MVEKDYIKMVQKELPDLITSLSTFIQIPSVLNKENATSKAPFGLEVDKALRFIEELAKKDGFETDFFDGYGVEISFGKSGPLILIAAHADVVPTSSEWSNPPFSGLIDKEYIHGRGAQDDKGPLLACYYALKLARDEGLIKNSRIKLVVGGNEESGSNCMKYYFNNLSKEQPALAFSPDASFPLIYGEKGIVNVKTSVHLSSARVIAINGGEASNSIAAQAEAIVNCKIDFPLFASYLTDNGLKGQIQENDGVSRIIMIGKSSHGSTPEMGINALGHLLLFIGKYIDEQFLPWGKIGLSLDGEQLGIKAFGSELKDLTVNLGLGMLEKNRLNMIFNIRYPETISFDEIKQKITKTMNVINAEAEIISHSSLLLFDKESLLVKTLLASYRNITNDFSNPYTIGGGTYSRNIKNCVAFGMLFPDSISYMHESNEKIKISELIKGCAIYLKALVDLDESASKKLY